MSRIATVILKVVLTIFFTVSRIKYRALKSTKLNIRICT
jgi:hypothetical protein